MTAEHYFTRHLFFCTNQREGCKQCCMDHDTVRLRNHAKARTKDLKISGAGGVRVNSAGCLDRCQEGPVCVVYPDAVWYTYKDTDDIDEIVERHLRDGEIVQRLKI